MSKKWGRGGFAFATRRKKPQKVRSIIEELAAKNFHRRIKGKKGKGKKRMDDPTNGRSVPVSFTDKEVKKSVMAEGFQMAEMKSEGVQCTHCGALLTTARGLGYRRCVSCGRWLNIFKR